MAHAWWEKKPPKSNQELRERIFGAWQKYCAAVWMSMEIEGTKVDQDGRPWSGIELQQLIGYVRNGIHIGPEYQPIQIEGCPDRGVATPQEARGILVRTYHELQQACTEMGINVSFIANHRCWGPSIQIEHFDRERSALLKERLPMAGRGGIHSGFQVHYAHQMELSDAYMQALAYLEGFAGLFLAISANSYDPTTEIHSLRAPEFNMLWTHKLTAWNSVDDFIKSTWRGIKRKVMSGPWDFHRLVKICQGSTEFRICDSMSDVMDAAMVQAMIIALMRQTFDRVRAGETLPIILDKETRTEELELSFNFAARSGISDFGIKMPSPFAGGEMRPIGEQLNQLADMLEPTMREDGTLPELAQFRQRIIEERSNGATRQASWWRKHQDGATVILADRRHFQMSLEKAQQFVEQHKVRTAA